MSWHPSKSWISAIGGITIISSGILLSPLFQGCKDSKDAHGVPNAKAAAPSVLRVSMRNVQFDPPTIEVKKGDVVEWKNDDIVPHTATSPHFDSKSIAPGHSWRHTFTDAGSFPYVCSFHPTMKGVVVVK